MRIKRVFAIIFLVVGVTLHASSDSRGGSALVGSVLLALFVSLVWEDGS